MMLALSEWLKQVIAVVLLASLVDLLLPNQTMQRYVRLIAGLFILLTLAGPMLNWIKSDFGTKLAGSLESVNLRPDNATQQLAQIEEDASKLRMSREEQASSLASAQLAAQIRETVEEEGQASVRDVLVKLAQGADGVARVESVSIVMESEAADATDQAGSAGEADPIREVDSIIIDLGSIGHEKGDADDQPVMAEEQTEERRLQEQRIIALVASRYGMATERIHVEMDRSATKS